jgi:hypothetical protein
MLGLEEGEYEGLTDTEGLSDGDIDGLILFEILGEKEGEIEADGLTLGEIDGEYDELGETEGL